MRNSWIFALLGIVLSTVCFGCGTGVGYSTLAPSIKQVSPQTIAAGTPGLTMTVKGSGFTANSAVLWNAAALPTQVIDANTLAAPVSSMQVATPATVQLRVMDTSTGDESASTPVNVVGADTKATTLAITAPALDTAQVGAVFTGILQATGGTPNYTWSIQAGSLPAGLTLASSTGVISGTPTASGAFAFTVQVADSGSPAQTKTASASITVNPSPLAIISAAVVSGQVNTPYSATLQAAGGTPAYTWSLKSGTLPAGLTLNAATGAISGTPTTAGAFKFTAQVSDAASPAQTQTAAFTLTISPSTLSISAISLGAAQAGTAYAGTLQATGGTPGYAWTITSGTLPSGLTLAPATGAISGTPTAVGTFAFTVQVSDNSTPAQTQTTTTSIAVSPSTLAIAPISLGAGQIGSTYTGALLATGGTPAYTWTLKSGSLPAGLTLSSAGVISGTPTTAGTFSFAAQVTDSASPAQAQTASGSITINASTLAIAPLSLGAGQIGTAYTGALQATGGTPAYTWSLKSGSLPAGLTLASTGTISGTPTSAGAFSFTVQVTDSASPAQTQTAAGAIIVAPSTLAIASISLGSAQIGVSYSGTLQATGGTPGYTWAARSGALPSGLTLSPAGTVSGTPTAAGSSTFTVQVTDSSSPAQTQTATATITVGASSLAISSAALPAGQNNIAYTATLSATGGTPGYTWAIKSGALPAGLSLNAAGALSGTPSASGTFTFTVQVTDNGSPAQTQTATTTLTINAAALAISSPSLAAGQSGVTYTGTLQATGGTPGYTWSLKSGTLPTGLSLNAGTGAISGTPTAAGTFAFTVQVADSASPAQVQSASASITINAATLAISSSTLAAGQSGAAYTGNFQATGGTPGYTWALKSGSLPTGLTLNAATGSISGTPTTSGSFTFTIQVADSGNPAQTQTAATTLVINAPGLAITSTSLASAQVGTAYTGTLQAAGGTPSYAWTIKSGTLPAGLSLNASTGAITGTPTTAGSSTFTVQVTDSASPAQAQTASFTLSVNASTLAVGTVNLPSAQQGATYNGSFQATGGTPTYTWSIKSGSLPTGLTLSATGALSGTPSATGTYTFVAQVTDSGNPAQTQTASETITVGASNLAVTTSTLAAGQNGTAYTATIQATGGTPGYSWSIKSGNLPAGLSLSPAGVLAGTPTASGTTTLTVQVTDSASPAQTQTATLSLTISPSTLAISSSTLAAGQNGTAYTGTLQATGGSPAYTWSLKTGTLPTGLTLNAATGSITGTPAATGTFAFTVQVTDTGNPAQTQTAATSITINAATLAISSSTLTAGQNGTAYTGTLQATGGSPAYTWSLKTGTLPTGLTLNAATGTITGTPTATGTFAFTVQVTDTGNPAQTQTAATSITINAATLAISSSTLTAGQNGTAYTGTLQATGGTPAYTWSLKTGTLPTGLTLNAATGTITGTPTAAGNFAFTVQVTDTGTPAQTQTAATSITINASTLAISSSTLGAGQNGTAYTATLQATGGTPAYTWSLKTGTLPTGLTLNAATGTITGTPTATGTFNFTIQVTDAGNPAQTQTAATSITINAATLAISSSTLTSGQNGTAYTATLQATGGTPAYTWSLKTGTLPTGLTLNAATGTITGTPTATGTFNFTIQVTDTGTPAQTQTASTSITVNAATLAVSNSTLAAGQSGTAYTATLQATGGTPAYTWSLKTGTLPTGLTLNAATGTITGTPTAAGAFSFTVQVTDTSSPAQTQTAATSITVKPAGLAITSSTLTTGQSGIAYTATLQATGGTPGYTWSLSSGSLPAGLTLSTAGVISGTPSTYGSSTFTAQVTDTSSPAQTQTASFTLNISPATLTINTAALASGQSGSSYSASLQATGGTPSYIWTLNSGSLPTGLTLSSTGTISGTASAAGTFTFTVKATDSGSPVQTQTASKSITISPSTLTILSLSLTAGESGTSYNLALLATGGTPGYTWSIKSGSLPSGLTLSAAGVLSGLPTASGTFALTVQVTDNSSPAQTATLTTSLIIAAAPLPPNTTGSTWYVRTDGGTRYSANMTSGQCDGTTDTPYPGSGQNQHCAFKDIRSLWEDGSYPDGTFPSWGWIGKGGDTYLIRGSIGTGVSYRIGWNNPSNAFDSATQQYWGFTGDPYDSGIPVPPSGTSGQHTRLLGENYASCSAASAKTQLHGGYAVWEILNMTGASYVDVACLDITDFSDCSLVGSATKTCNKSIGTLSDFSTTGIQWSNTSTNDTLTNVHVHGLAGNGMNGPTGDGDVFSYIDLIGNASSGWNADAGDGTTGSGSLLVQNFNISWNGCAEEYPIKDALPYFQCADDSSGGYGDGFGTATLISNPGWQAHFDQGIASYNTQDGLDALHLRGAGSSMTITRVLAFGNMGQQIKVGGQAGTAENNVIVTNCNALRGAIPGTPAGYNANLGDFCRAADTGVLVTVGPGSITRFDNNTIFSASATGVEVECDGTNGPCDGTSLIDYRNNIFVGYLNDTAHGYTNGGSGNYSNPIYDGTSLWPFNSAGSFFSNNITYHPKSNWVCPASGEVNSLCADPLLADENWHPYGFNNAEPTVLSPVLGKGITVPGVTLDFNGVTRSDPPSMGAFEK